MVRGVGFTHHRQQNPKNCRKGSYRTVPLSHTKYRGRLFKRWKRSGSGAMAKVCKLKSSGKSSIQSIVIPKKTGRRKKKGKK